MENGKMNNRISHHFGLNHVSPNEYEGWDGLLSGCQNDATDLRTLATAAGYFNTSAWFDDECTIKAIRKAFVDASTLGKGDEFLLTFSGHGSTDEAICMFDGLLYDWQLHNMVAPLACNTVIVLDSCHSGGMDKAYNPRIRKKIMPDVVDYAIKRDSWPPQDKEDVVANALWLCACQPWEFALDGTKNGAFTECLKRVFQAQLDRQMNVSWRQMIVGAMELAAENYPSQHPIMKMHGIAPEAFADKAIII